ncbi:uncharacterized protein FIBRA_01299 [Fibroporia radiculosa]|uniref:Heterokaryon incompatibility domain-containing protein n=1 Tax=Fibroporia radiculosa TaxID=599839 RepID=J4G0W9_9APHY|nr:uncharacterized protein FIBRA_01299 [Fibroporia radiculosa]CCL99283.1 predicted protein [Fibroporia radiculosa]
MTPQIPNSETTSYLCPTCSTLDFHHILQVGVPREEAIPLGSLVEILSKAVQCRMCRLIKTAFQRTWLLDKQDLATTDLAGIECALFAMECGCLRDPAPPMRDRCHRLFILPSDRPQKVYDVMRAAQSGLTLDIQLLEEDAHIFDRSREVHGRKVSDTVDITLVKEWIRMCEEEHREVCKVVWWRGADETLPDGVRMVDVVTMSIVPAPPACRYIALSYLWGGVGEEYQTTQANISERASPNSLDTCPLPVTITDSILLTRELGERYLWVDALCIIQDSAEDKALQIEVMELIYGSSFLTIFAAGGRNALPGLRPGTRAQRQHIEVVQDLHFAVPLPTLREVLAQSIWGTRGWTYQELMLSRRRLYFTNQQVYFECGQEIWCEDVLAESKRLPRSYHPLRNTGGGNFTYLREPPSWLKRDYTLGYMTAIGQYTQRKLTNEADAVDAISALTNAMAKGFKLAGGVPSQAFRYGMAVVDLNQALLWQPTAGTLLTRRCIPKGAPWPSWSWAGWCGPVQYQDVWFGSQTPHLVETLIDKWYIWDGSKLIQLDVRTITFATAYPEEEGGLTRYVPPCGPLSLEDGKVSKDGTLVFYTTAANFTVERVHNASEGMESADEQYALFAILAVSESRLVQAGRIYMPSSTPSPSCLRFAVLSRTNGIVGIYDEDVYGSRYSGCYLYVIALGVAGSQDEDQRLGIGIIFEKAWLAAGAKGTSIFLT